MKLNEGKQREKKIYVERERELYILGQHYCRRFNLWELGSGIL